MILKIDTEKSISNNKIYFSKGRFFDFIDTIILYGLGVFVLPFIAIRYEIQHLDTFTDDILGSILTIILPLILSSVIFYKFYTRKDLKRYSDIDKDLIIQAVIELDWKFESSNQKYMIIKAGTWQRQISIIFDKNDLLIHSLRFGKSDFYLSETSRLEILMNKIKEIKIKNAAQSSSQPPVK